jgi:hypothetical protein
MAEQGEAAPVRLQEVHAVTSNPYLEHEWDLLEPDRDHLVAVVFRVNMGRDAFPVPVVMDRRQTPEDRMIPEARRRAEAILRAAADELAGQDRG